MNDQDVLNKPVDTLFNSLMPIPVVIETLKNKGGSLLWKLDDWDFSRFTTISTPDLEIYVKNVIKDLINCPKLKGIYSNFYSLESSNCLQFEGLNIGESLSNPTWIVISKGESSKDILHTSLSRLASIHVGKKFLAENQDLFLAEGYSLEITQHGIILLANSSHGCFNGLQTLLQILRWTAINSASEALPPIRITDFPKLAVRAFH